MVRWSVALTFALLAVVAMAPAQGQGNPIRLGGGAVTSVQVADGVAAATAAISAPFQLSEARLTYVKVVPTPWNPAFGNGTAGASGWWTTVALDTPGGQLAKGMTVGEGPVDLGTLQPGIPYTLRLTVNVPVAALAEGASYRVSFALAARSAGSGSGNGGELDSSVPILATIAVVPPGEPPGGGRAAPAPTDATTAPPSLTPVAPPVAAEVPNAPASTSPDAGLKATSPSPSTHDGAAGLAGWWKSPGFLFLLLALLLILLLLILLLFARRRRDEGDEAPADAPPVALHEGVPAVPQPISVPAAQTLAGAASTSPDAHPYGAVHGAAAMQAPSAAPSAAPAVSAPLQAPVQPTPPSPSMAPVVAAAAAHANDAPAATPRAAAMVADTEILASLLGRLSGPQSNPPSAPLLAFRAPARASGGSSGAASGPEAPTEFPTSGLGKLRMDMFLAREEAAALRSELALLHEEIQRLNGLLPNATPPAARTRVTEPEA